MKKEKEILDNKADVKIRKRSAVMRILKYAAVAVGGLIICAVAFIVALTLWLTPQRLTKIINNEASGNLEADVRASNVRFSIWSTFPHFCIDADSLIVVSRTLKGISPQQRGLLPAGSDSLLSTGKIHAGINILPLLAGDIVLRKVEVDELDLNVVALNDSINNYSIFPSASAPEKIPYFKAESVIVSSPRRIRYYSAATAAKFEINLSHGSMKRNNGKDDYSLDIAGIIDAAADNLHLLSNFPFHLDGDIHLLFNPFRIDVKNYTVDLGGTKGKLDLRMNLENDMAVKSLVFNINSLNPISLLNYFPEFKSPEIENLHADLNISASAKLISPYSFSSTSLPSLQLNLNLDPGDIAYDISDNNSYSLSHSAIAGMLFFNGADPTKSYFRINPFTLTADGITAEIKAEALSITDSPSIKASLHGNADLKELSSSFPFMSGMKLSGNCSAEADISFSIPAISSLTKLENIAAAGEIQLDNVYFKDSSRAIGGNADLLSLNFSTSASSLSSSGIEKGDMRLSGNGKNLRFNSPQGNMSTASIGVKSDIAPAGNVAFNNAKAIPVDLLISAGSLSYSRPADTLSVSSKKVTANLYSGLSVNSAVSDNLRLDLEANGIRILKSATSLSAGKLSSSVDISAAGKRKAVNSSEKGNWREDSLLLKQICHSDPFLTANTPAALKDFIRRWNCNVRLYISQGTLLSDIFPATNRFSDINLSISPDSVALESCSLASRSSRLSLSGKVGNLHDFLISDKPVELPVELDLQFDTIHINQLARTYENGVILRHGKKAVLVPQRSDSLSPSDTMAMLIPRNIVAKINASAKETQYRDLRLYNLSTQINVADGDAHIDTLTVSTDFGNAGIALDFTTSNVENIAMNMHAGIGNINVVRFFRNFHTLLLMMPQMKNLSGNLSAEADMKMSIFPNMYINIPSVYADIFLYGRNLKVHQSPFIRKITKMMLINTDSDIDIANMDVHASVHDNLLELYPFDFEFNRYHLTMGGLNNFDGQLYYHIGVNKSPVPFPFGINIKGKFHDPELRFGGASYKVKKGVEITSSIMEDNRVNMMKELKYYLREFIHKAAEADSSSSF